MRKKGQIMPNRNQDARIKSERIHVRLTDEERIALEENAQALGISNSSYLRLMLSLPLETQRRAVEAYERGEKLVLSLDTTSLEECVNAIRRAGYQLDYALHALNTLSSKPNLSEERQIELLRNANSYATRSSEIFCEANELLETMSLCDRVMLDMRYMKPRKPSNEKC